MQLKNFICFLKESNIIFCENESMKKHTTFKIGGAADVFIKPDNTDDLVKVLKAAEEYSVPVFIIGNGSNLLVSDRGIEGAVIDMSGLGGIDTNGDEIVCGAGESLRKLCLAARDNSLAGLQFAYGIPGTVGGALFMNAGAYGGEMADVTVSAVCLDKNLKTIELSKEQMQLSYRNSAFKTNGCIILSVKFKLSHGEKDKISAEMDEIFKRRQDKQPLDYPSAGSTFKRPEGYFAGTLIDNAGLKGKSVGGAAVSEKHAGFVINRDNATADDVLKLIKTVKETIKEKNNVDLCEEVIFVGRR